MLSALYRADGLFKMGLQEDPHRPPVDGFVVALALYDFGRSKVLGASREGGPTLSLYGV